MDITIIGLIALGVGGVFVAVFMFAGKNKEASKNKKSSNDSKNKSNSITHNKNVEDMQKSDKEIKRKDIFSFVEFDKIADDMIIQDKETKYTMVLQCKGINYDLMSDVEQLAVEEGFITFLNTLKHPIQLYVQARTINLKNSLDMYKERVTQINEQFNEANEHYKKVTDNINSTDKNVTEAKIEREKFLNISEYAQDITKYVEKLSLNKHMLQRKFYVVLSYFKSEVNTTSEFTKQEIHDICYRELYTRAQAIASGLMTCSVSAKMLNSNELAELLYISYNRDDEKLMDIKTALDSGFYRLYSTTQDVMDKKKEVMDKTIQEEAMNRIEEAINKAIDMGMIKTREDMEDEYENEVDKQAINLLDNADIDENDKKKIQQVIIDDHNKNAENRKKEREKKYKDFEKTQEDIAKSNEELNDVAEDKKDNQNNSETDMIV